MDPRCSNILYETKFDPRQDFTVSFNYNFDTQQTGSSQNNGFCVFFVTGNTTSLAGGGPGPGLGVADTSTSSILNNLYFVVGVDRVGDFCVQGAPPYFTTGLPSQTPDTITVRKNYSNIDFLSCVVPSDPIIFDEDTEITIRFSMRKMFGTVNVDVLSGYDYVNIASISTLIHPDSLPDSLKFGISYSGDSYFTVKDISLNFNQSF